MDQRGPIICLRPRPGIDQTLARAREAGFGIEGFPLAEVTPLAWSAPLADAFDALLVGSANVFRHGGEQLEKLRDLPVFAVGATTAAEAAERGFTVAQTGQGGLQALLDSNRGKPMRFLRLTATDRVDLKLPSGQSIEEIPVYTVLYREIDRALELYLENGAIVMLHSATMAAHFASECRRLGLRRGNLTLAALGPRIADAAGDGWRDVAIAEKPNDAALLAMLENMCQ